MLILIPGATGNLGTKIVRAAIERGHRVRGLGRSAAKLPAELREQLESFVEVSGFDDRANLDIACHGADAIICAYGPDPVLMLDGQLALLRAAERAGITRFHAASWNLDWENMALGVIESYDPLLAFQRAAALTSPIKPLYVFCGVLATTLFGVPGAGALEGESAMWIRTNDTQRVLNVIGDGTVPTPYTTEADAAAFSVAITTADGADRGGFYRFCSDEFTLQDLAQTYTKVRGGAECQLNYVMDKETCRQLVAKARKEAEDAGEVYKRWKGYMGLVYGLSFAEGTYNPKPVDASRHPDVRRTSLAEYIQENSWI